MTKRQAQVLAVLQAPRDYTPSYSEIAAEIGLKSKSGIHRVILALEAQGKIKRMAFRHRTVEVIA